MHTPLMVTDPYPYGEHSVNRLDDDSYIRVEKPGEETNSIHVGSDVYDLLLEHCDCDMKNIRRGSVDIKGEEWEIYHVPDLDGIEGLEILT